MPEQNTQCIAPWWERWPDWWREQQRYFEGSTKLRGSFDEEDKLHLASWTGTFEAAGETRPIQIRWGPGTPFFSPRIYPLGCFSGVHQLRDGSMCLATPVEFQKGWYGVVDILYWLKRAEQWFERFVAEKWGVERNDWQFFSLTLPFPEYRFPHDLGMVIAIPPEWEGELSDFGGSLTALLPRSRRGLGAILGWSTAQKKSEGVRWSEASGLVNDSEEVGGWWNRAPLLDEYAAASVENRIRSSLQRWSVNIDKIQRRLIQGKSSLVAHQLPLNINGQYERVWQFYYYPAFPNPGHIQHPFQSFDEWSLPCGPWAGVSLHPKHLNVRRAAGRNQTMNQQIESASLYIVGLGALGSEVAHLLAQEGVGRFCLVDGDTLLPGNVARHRADLSQVGKLKVETMRDAIHRINPSTKVDILPYWIDTMIPDVRAKLERGLNSICLGLTGHEASEHLLGELATEWGVPCIHAWLERNGSLLRLIRVLPGKDPTLLQLARSPETLPCSSPATHEAQARECADMIVPGSASNIHAAGNFIARAVLDLITGRAEEANHFLFAPSGLADAGDEVPATLKRRFGFEAYVLKA